MLSDTAARNAKPCEKPYELTDGGELYVIVNPNGSRWWRFRYRVEGREKRKPAGNPVLPCLK